MFYVSFVGLLDQYFTVSHVGKFFIYLIFYMLVIIIFFLCSKFVKRF